MANFVPRSVIHKVSKTKQTLQAKQRNMQNKSIDTPASCSAFFQANRNEIEDGNLDQTSAKTAEQGKSRKNEGNILEETSDIVYFSKNQRWPKEDEPVCVVCGKYGEFICDQTEQDVCSKECKARDLQRRPVADRTRQGEGSKILGSMHNEVKTEENYNITISGSHVKEDRFESEQNKTYKYNVHSQIASLTNKQVQELRNRMEISIRGDTSERPVLEFAQCGLNEQLLKNLKKSGYLSPTPVQMQVIPIALCGRDLLACAQTGSGKTAAFLVPVITKIHHNVASRCKSSTPMGLILAPTRELCMQIENQAKELMAGLPNMRTSLVVGGMPMPNQIYRLQQGVQIVFATPGRLVEILSKASLDFSEIQMLIIDEVDVLMQMGFENQIKSILENIPAARQTLLFSATIPPSVERISSTLLTNPVWISVGPPSAPNMDVKQVVIWVEDKSKKKRLFALLKDSKYFTPPILVFVDSRLGADMLSDAIQETCDVRCTSMHGEKVQDERTRILTAFLSGEYDVLVCTGVLGRGLDLRCVKQVIIFDMPSSVDEYIHQIGRAGRLGSNGLAISFINNTNKGVFLDLVETVQQRGVKLPDELLNSPHLSSQQYEREYKRKSRKRKQEETYVNRENLMDILKKSTFRRRLKDR